MHNPEQNTELLVDSLRYISGTYSPNDEVQEQLSERELIMIIGPLAAGKTTIMDAAAELEPDDFGRLAVRTTRPQRPHESGTIYDFRPHSQETLSGIRGKAKAGSLLHLSVDPQAGYVETIEAASLGPRYAMLETAPAALGRYATIGFSCDWTIAVVPPAAIWYSRFQQRVADEAMTSSEAKNQLEQSIAVVDWCIEQRNDIHWIINGTQSPQDNARRITNTARGHRWSLQGAYKIASMTRAVMITVLKQYER